jgi:hypothetical protein
VEIAQVTPRTVTTFTDTAPAGTYFFVVRSFSENANSVSSNEASATISVITRTGGNASEQASANDG